MGLAERVGFFLKEAALDIFTWAFLAFGILCVLPEAWWEAAQAGALGAPSSRLAQGVVGSEVTLARRALTSLARFAFGPWLLAFCGILASALLEREAAGAFTPQVLMVATYTLALCASLLRPDLESEHLPWLSWAALPAFLAACFIASPGEEGGPTRRELCHVLLMLFKDIGLCPMPVAVIGAYRKRKLDVARMRLSASKTEHGQVLVCPESASRGPPLSRVHGMFGSRAPGAWLAKGWRSLQRAPAAALAAAAFLVGSRRPSSGGGRRWRPCSAPGHPVSREEGAGTEPSTRRPDSPSAAAGRQTACQVRL